MHVVHYWQTKVTKECIQIQEIVMQYIYNQEMRYYNSGSYAYIGGYNSVMYLLLIKHHRIVYFMTENVSIEKFHDY